MFLQTDAQWVEMQRAQTAQLQLLKDQLAAETASRIDAQVWWNGAYFLASELYWVEIVFMIFRETERSG